MATKKTAAAPADDNDKCENCGACKHCGSGGVKFVPYPVYPNPYAQPYRPFYPYWSVVPPSPYISGGTTVQPNSIQGTGQTFTNHATVTLSNYSA